MADINFSISLGIPWAMNWTTRKWQVPPKVQQEPRYENPTGSPTGDLWKWPIPFCTLPPACQVRNNAYDDDAHQNYLLLSNCSTFLWIGYYGVFPESCLSSVPSSIVVVVAVVFSSRWSIMALHSFVCCRFFRMLLVPSLYAVGSFICCMFICMLSYFYML